MWEGKNDLRRPQHQRLYLSQGFRVAASLLFCIQQLGTYEMVSVKVPLLNNT